MVTVAVAAIVLAVLRISSKTEFVFLLFAILFASPWLLAPARLRRSHRVSLDSSYTPIDPNAKRLPVEFSNTYKKAEDCLSGLQFSAIGCFCRPNIVPNSTGYVALFRNPQTMEMARMATAIVGIGNRRRVSSLVVFESEFEGGIEVVTSNSRAPNCLPPIGRGVHYIALPEMGGLTQLYRAHRARVDEIAGGRARHDPLGSGLEAYFDKGERRLNEHRLECGYYELDQEHRVLRLTWKGACLTAWKLIWPVGAIRMAYRRWLARRMLRRLELS
jgi:hypothetical protein